MKRILILLSSTVLLATLACHRHSAIVGSWHEVNGKDAISFSQDGTYNATMAWGPAAVPTPLSGKYRLEGHTISLTSSGNPSDSMTCDFKIDGDEMTLTYTMGGMVKINGTTARFKRL